MLIAWHFSGNSSPVDQRDQEDGQIDTLETPTSVLSPTVTSGGANFSSWGVSVKLEAVIHVKYSI